MLHYTNDLLGYKLAASDGEIGLIEDFYFDDQNWALRYLVVDTGSWLAGRLVLISPHAFGRLDPEEKSLSVNLTRQQIEDSPSIESHQPVSRQHEVDYCRYYRWQPYWNGGTMWGLGAEVMVAPPSPTPAETAHQGDETHLRSAKAVKGYTIHATDGLLGEISGFIVDDQNWTIRDMIVETGHWYAGKEALIPTTAVTRIKYEDSEVFVNLSQAEIRRSGECGATKPMEEILWPGSTDGRPIHNPPLGEPSTGPRDH